MYPALTLFPLTLLLAISSQLITTSADYVVDPSFKIDVHSHIIPSQWRQALIANGYPVRNGILYTDGFPVPLWNLTSHIANMNGLGVNYSTISVSAPGLSFLAHDTHASATLARQINNEMYSYTKKYPTRLGAMCLLPLPHIKEALAEIEYCLDTLHFDGVGMYSNFNGIYLGDRALDSVLCSLNARGASVFVHPAAPGCKKAALGYPDPMTEYPFESIRAMENMLLTGQRANYSAINIIFPHGGGAMPYLAGRIASVAALSGFDPLKSLAQFKGYLFDTASASSEVQLKAMKTFFGGVNKMVTGTDNPYVPTDVGALGLSNTQSSGGFTGAEIGRINNQNALGVFPGVAKKLGFIKV